MLPDTLGVRLGCWNVFSTFSARVQRRAPDQKIRYRFLLQKYLGVPLFERPVSCVCSLPWGTAHVPRRPANYRKTSPQGKTFQCVKVHLSLVVDTTQKLQRNQLSRFSFSLKMLLSIFLPGGDNNHFWSNRIVTFLCKRATPKIFNVP